MAETCKIDNCVAAAVNVVDRTCAGHQKFHLAGSEDHCRKCGKKIRSGTYARKRDDGGLEHQECPLDTTRRRS
jgi:hypothetical protein